MEKCFACDKKLGANRKAVSCIDEQTVFVGSDCYRKIANSPEGYQPPKGGPRLFLMGGVSPSPEVHYLDSNPIEFLGYEIGHPRNNDGCLLRRKGVTSGFDCHLGYYGGNDDPMAYDIAKRAAVLHFMLARPEIFAEELASIISDRVRRADLPVDYYRFADAVKKAGLTMPEELTDGGGQPAACKREENCTYGGIHLYFKGEVFYGFM